MSVFKGSGVALITPFTCNYKVDYKSLERIINYQLENNTDAVIICGTTGEASTLSDYEHLSVIKRCIDIVNKRIPVIAGTGSNNTSHAIMMSKKAEELGADGLLIVTPYYNKATQKGLEAHYKAISDEVNIPILLYNVPSRTGCNMMPQTVINIIKDNKNIVGIKEASGNINQIIKLIDLAKVQQVPIDLYSGNDDEVIKVLEYGGIGVISVCANIVPNRTHDMVYKYIDGDIDNAIEIQKKQKELSDVLFKEVSPVPIKEAMYQKGLIREKTVRLPLINIEKNNKKELMKVLKKQKII